MKYIVGNKKLEECIIYSNNDPDKFKILHYNVQKYTPIPLKVSRYLLHIYNQWKRSKSDDIIENIIPIIDL